MLATSSTELAVLVRELRQALNLSQRRFAAWLRVSVRTVNRWENGHSVPSASMLQLIEEKLKESPDSYAIAPTNTEGPDPAALVAKAAELRTRSGKSVTNRNNAERNLAQSPSTSEP